MTEQEEADAILRELSSLELLPFTKCIAHRTPVYHQASTGEYSCTKCATEYSDIIEMRTLGRTKHGYIVDNVHVGRKLGTAAKNAIANRRHSRVESPYFDRIRSTFPENQLRSTKSALFIRKIPILSVDFCSISTITCRNGRRLGPGTSGLRLSA